MTTTTTAKPAKGIRLSSLSWALLGTLFRNASLKGNTEVAQKAKNAIYIKKELRKNRKSLRKARRLV